MELNLLRNVLLWCTVINYCFLTFWSLMIVIAGDWVYEFHSRWFPMSREAFNIIHYAGMGFYKVFILVFNLVPLITLWTLSR